MAFVWNPLFLIAAVDATALLLGAAFVFFTGRHRSLNRRLAFATCAEALTTVAFTVYNHLALVAAFFVVEKLVETFASRTLGVFVGAIATGLMLFFVPRLNKLVEGVGNKAAPHVTTAEYLAYKKLELYRGAVESPLADGIISPEERAILDRLAERLEIGAADAKAMEADVARILGVTSA
ncbi:MAG: hypothetical protein ACYDCK_08530 [Thermoplasmatota archaeon]